MISKAPFPLYALLTIYLKAEHECYVNYMEGFKALVSWLGPIEKPLTSLDHYDVNYHILGNYLTQRMHDILDIHEDCIIGCFIHEVLPKLKSKGNL